MVAKDRRKYTTLSTEYGRYKFLSPIKNTHGPVASHWWAMKIKGLFFCLTYSDDIIYSETEQQQQQQQHLKHIRQVFNRLWKANIKLN